MFQLLKFFACFSQAILFLLLKNQAFTIMNIVLFFQNYTQFIECQIKFEISFLMIYYKVTKLWPSTSFFSFVIV